MTNTIFIIITIIITLTTKATKGDITCIAVSTPDDTIIMCSVGVDIPTTLDGINVQYYDSPGLPDGDTILMCNYKDSGDTICHQKSDIVYHEIIKENVIIKRKPHQHRGGQYKCQVVPPLGVAIIPCNITFIEVPTTKPPPTSPQPLVTGYPAGGYGQQGHKTQHTSSDQIRVATFVFLLLVFVIVIASILHWKQKRIRQWWKAKRTSAPQSIDVELETESLTKEEDPKEDESSPAMKPEVYYYNKGWEDASRRGFADKSQIPEGKPWLDPMKPDTEKEMPPKTASMLKGVYEAPVVRHAKLAMTREQWREQQKQKQKMAKAETDKETREEKTQKRTSKETTLDDSNSRPASTYGAPCGVPPPDATPGATRPEAQCYVQPVTVSTASQGQEQMMSVILRTDPQDVEAGVPLMEEMFVLLDEDANRTDPQDLEAGVPLMEGEQETDGERITAPSTVDEARRQVRDADAKVQETKNEMIETKKAANKNANKRDEEVQTQAAEAKERYEKAQKVLEEAKSVLKTIEKAEKNKGKNKLFRP